MPKILLVGSDSQLLETRALVLSTVSPNVVHAFLDEALKKLESEKFELVVLCHSLSREDRERLTSAIHKRSPLTRILQVAYDLWTDKAHDEAGPVLVISPEPSKLVRRVTELLQALPNHHIEEAPIRSQAELRPASKRVDLP